MHDKTIIIDQIRDIIEQKLLVEASEIGINDQLDLSLGIDPETDLPLLVSIITQKFNLTSDAKELISQVNTLDQLASIVIEEAELG